MSRVTLVAAAAAFALGLGGGWVLFAGGGAPCWEVRDDLEDATQEQVESLGQRGAHGAVRATAARAADRPDCFSPEDRELLRRMAEAPSEGSPEGATPGKLTVEPTERG